MEKIIEIDEVNFNNIISIWENDYNDYKSKLKKSSDLIEDVIWFANAEWWTIYIWIKEERDKNWKIIWWIEDWFEKIEDANGFTWIFNETIPSIIWLNHEFIKYKGKYILKFIIPKSIDLHSTKSFNYFIRKWSSTIPIKWEDIEKIKYLKWITKYEDKIIDLDYNLILKSDYFISFMEKELDFWNRQSWYNYLINNNFLDKNKSPRICTILWFAGNPQVHLKTSILINIYWFQKNSRTYKYDRERLEDTKKIVWPIEVMIRDSIDYIEKFFKTKKVLYPIISIKEAIVNAVLHREYSIQDDIKIEIFDNQIEIISPWLFPWNDRNINPLKYQRNIRNNKLYWILSRISDFEKDREKKLNQDRWEWIQTIFNLAKKWKYMDPKYLFDNWNTIVILNFTSIETYETKILEYLKKNWTIKNKEAREITWEEDKEKIKNIFKKLENKKKIERVDFSAPKAKVRYKLKQDIIEDYSFKQSSFF